MSSSLSPPPSLSFPDWDLTVSPACCNCCNSSTVSLWTHGTQGGDSEGRRVQLRRWGALHLDMSLGLQLTPPSPGNWWELCFHSNSLPLWFVRLGFCGGKRVRHWWWLWWCVNDSAVITTGTTTTTLFKSAVCLSFQFAADLTTLSVYVSFCYCVTPALTPLLYFTA